MTNHVESELARLPEPAPPATLVRTVMARVAEERAPGALISPASKERAHEARVGTRSDLSAWVAALAGLAMVFVSWIGGQLEAGPLRDLLSSSQGGMANPVTTSLKGSPMLGLTLGLLLYVTGLFAPLHKRR